MDETQVEGDDLESLDTDDMLSNVGSIDELSAWVNGDLAGKTMSFLTVVMCTRA